MILGIFLIFLTGVSWICWGIVMGRVPKEGMSSDVFLFFMSLMATIISVIIGVNQGVPAFDVIQQCMILSLVLSGICNGLQLYLISRAMQRGPNGMVWLIAQAGFIIPFLIGGASLIPSAA